MPLPSASRLALAEVCLGAAVLAGVRREDNDACAAGRGRHRFLERVQLIGRESALAEIPSDAPWRETCVALPVEEIPRGEPEVAFAYDPTTDTARRLGTSLGRDYSGALPGEVTGTADLVVPGLVPLVIDYKGRESVGPAIDHLQLNLYALCVARTTGAEEVATAIVYVHEDGTLEWDRAQLGAWDLAAVAARVAEIAARVAQADEAAAAGRLPPLVDGPHCQRCPALTVCPAQVELARALVREAEATPANELLARLAPLPDADAGAALDRLERASAVIEAQVAALKERAKKSGLTLPDGSRLVPVEQTRRDVVVATAMPLLVERFGAQVESVVKRSIKVEDLRSLARQLNPSSPRKAGDALLEELSARGAVKTSTFVKLCKRAAGGAS